MTARQLQIERVLFQVQSLLSRPAVGVCTCGWGCRIYSTSATEDQRHGWTRASRRKKQTGHDPSDNNPSLLGSIFQKSNTGFLKDVGSKMPQFSAGSFRLKAKQQQSDELQVKATSSRSLTSDDLERRIKNHIKEIEEELQNLKTTRQHEDRKWHKFVLGIMLCSGLIVYNVFYKDEKMRWKFSINVPGNQISMVGPEKTGVNFSHVKGIDEVKEELEIAVKFLKDPKKYATMGAKIPKGVLMVGPPGCGKTFLAKAVAGEAGVMFFYASGSSFDEMYVGVGAKRIRDLFEAAKDHAPCIIFIDEIDSVGVKRTDNNSFAYQTLHQLLNELDGFDNETGVIVIAATNRSDFLDDALVRPGRFDVVVSVPLPDLKGREELFEHYLDKVRCDSSIDVNKLARGTFGMSGADISNIVNQAAFQAARTGKTEVSMTDMDFAKDKIMMGAEKTAKLTDQKMIEVMAVREAAHAIVSYYTKHTVPLYKTTILRRGTNLGQTQVLPSKEIYNQTKEEISARLDFYMAGRVAEELVFGKDNITTLSAPSIKRATELAKAYVTQCGMSEKAGIRVYSRAEEALTSPEYQDLINQEINRLLKEAHKRAQTVLQKHRTELTALAENLKKYETLSKEEVETILQGKSLKK
ncbi:ATP-dependent zinc metalloprotease YME1L1-like [Ostrea edulis]|uniref:ATP-dependent zinc metalloprotease YME1L1-like n=1 Tax=Ostrea edulis TaxID=37623 RepID=UPI0024AF1A45|nr:ATP-dependent zinc metalloprotease YME1L1-like [Ostrea edulis]